MYIYLSTIVLSLKIPRFKKIITIADMPLGALGEENIKYYFFSRGDLSLEGGVTLPKKVMNFIWN